MIEKLKPTITGFYEKPKIPNAYEYLDKINELVDAVNEFQEMLKSCDNQIGILAAQIAKLQHDNSEKTNCQENVQDEFVEQRKWIGKLCKFWNDDTNFCWFYKLKEIVVDDYIAENMFVYKHCEPVKPDDDIIYKGGDDDDR